MRMERSNENGTVKFSFFVNHIRAFLGQIWEWNGLIKRLQRFSKLNRSILKLNRSILKLDRFTLKLDCKQ